MTTGYIGAPGSAARKRQHRAESEIADVRRYSNKYNCPIEDAALDVLTDGPCTIELAQDVCRGLEIEWEGSRFESRIWESQEEVNQYYRELYDN